MVSSHDDPRGSQAEGDLEALDRARRKAYFRLLPLIFTCFGIAYIDRVNVGFAKLEMQKDLAPLGFTESVFGFGMGIFFVGYVLLEIPGSLLVERWSARKWISRIMISWGLIAGLTAFVRTPDQFYAVRFALGLAEAGFFPGVIVYMTHWFPRRDRTRTLAWFFIATPIAQMIAPILSSGLMGIGEEGRPTLLGLVGWQWVFLAWGVPAIVLGLVVLAFLTDRPGQASWLSLAEKAALEGVLARERAELGAGTAHRSILPGLTNPRVLLLSAAYFFIATGNYGVELYMASILRDWYRLDVKGTTWLIIIPPVGSLIGQLFVGWNSARTGEQRWHASLPMLLGALAVALIPATFGNKLMTVALFTLAMTGLKAYLPAFWALPSLLFTAEAAAASIGLINSFGNLGGWIGPWIVGVLKENTETYSVGLWVLAGSMTISGVIVASLGIGATARRQLSNSPDASAVTSSAS